MAEEQIRFSQLLEQHIESKVQRIFSQMKLTPTLMREIRLTIKDTLSGVFQRSNHNLSEVALNWLTNQFFKRIRVNDVQSIDELIVLNEYNLSQLSYNDVKLLCDLFDQTDFGPSLKDELHTRSAS